MVAVRIEQADVGTPDNIIPLPLEPEQPKPEPKYKPDDDEMALLMADDWNGSYRYLHANWHVWERGCWQGLHLQEMRQAIRVYLRNFRKHGIRVSNGQVNALEQLLQADMYFSDRDYMRLEQEQERYVNLGNGIFDLTKFKLLPHDPAMCFTTQLAFDFDPNAQCPMFEKFLATSLVNEDESPDTQMIALVQEAIAYSMTARTDMKASFWCVGPKDSGKSTLIAFIRGLMGSLHATIDLNQLATNRFLLSGIVGKRVVTFTEASESSVLPDALYKAMTGGSDEIYADVKNKPGIAFRPIAKFWWAMNGAPRVTDRTGATLRRLKPIIFRRTVPEHRRIGNLERLLMDELPGVFNWALDGYIRLCERGEFTTPAYSREWLDKYELENDTERQFLAERYDPQADERVQAQVLFDDYALWCQRNGFRNKNRAQVSKEWERLGLYVKKIEGLHYWYGIRQKSEI